MAGPASGGRLVAVHVGRFALAGVVALTILGLATSIASRRVGEREAVSDARTTTLVKAQGLVEPAVTDDLLRGTAPAVARVDGIVRDHVLDRSLVRVKIWTEGGTIIYSDEPRLIGSTYQLAGDEVAAIRSGQIAADVSDLSKPENRYERSQRKLLEVYLPIRTPSGQPVLFEAYYRYALVQQNGRRLWNSFAPIALGSLVMLQLVQVPLAWSLARRLAQRLREREGLLQRALDASEVERRQIASDLHDGVVQDLAGVAYSLAAVARSPGNGDGAVAVAVEKSAETVRASIRALRSLVVDIYPPDFGEEPLRVALADLLERAGESGVGTDLEVTGLPDRLPDQASRLIYRVAQEGVRNALRHAGATTIQVRAEATSGRASVEVADDGRGIDEAETAQAAAGGHLGLRALRGLVTDAGGTLEVRRRGPDGGTTLRVEVPI
ncbi:MAG: two-component system, NarL family, sensor kinase [Actinomycetota bacterium]|nr:two-component system, NarL family, sensor kinase [Actinomycetota bacterium]